MSPSVKLTIKGLGENETPRAIIEVPLDASDAYAVSIMRAVFGDSGELPPPDWIVPSHTETK